MSALTLIWESFWHILLNILVGINSVVGNPGVSIIIFTVLMRLLTVPLTMRALKSSRNMQQIQPLIKEIQKKHGKDRQKQQEETMKLYAQYGVNPAASCFPMLIQLPIFIGLYSALRFTLPQFTGNEAEIAQQTAAHLVDLKAALWNSSWVPFANFGAPFGWVPSLAMADPVYIWPILSGLFQFIQSRMSMPVRDPSMPMDSQQKMMQNMMQFMPLYIVFISWGFPAGNVIYWAFSSLFGAAQQYFITGWGTLPDLPGLGFLPRKQAFVPLPPPLPEAADGSVVTPRRGGVMNWMMNKAVQAQEAQKAAAEQPAEEGQPTGPARRVVASAETLQTANGGSALRGGNRNRPSNGGATTQPVARGKGSIYGSAQGGSTQGGSTQGGSTQEPREVPTSSMKYASDLKYRASGNGVEGNGAGSSNGATALPRKKKNKR